MRSLLGIVALVHVLVPAVAGAQVRSGASQRPETYLSAAVDSNGNLIIRKSNDQLVVVEKEAGQTTFSTPEVSSAGTAVGAQAMFKHSSASYDIPLQLVVVANGTVHRFEGTGLPIFQWGFADSGTRVAFGQEPLHFGCSTHYELREIQSEALIDSADIPQPCGQIPDPKPVPIPRWVADLIAKRTPLKPPPAALPSD